MRGIHFCLLAFVLIGNAVTQTTTTGKATSTGTCSLANTGNGNKSIIVNCGVGAEQGKKILSLLNEALRDKATMNEKLDKLLIFAQKPVNQMQCEGSACVQGTNYGSLTVNNGAPRMPVTEDQRSAITAAMKLFAGRGFGLQRGNQTKNSADFADQIKGALLAAGMTCEQDFPVEVVGSSPRPIPGGVIVSYGRNRKADMTTLMQVLQPLELPAGAVGNEFSKTEDDSLMLVVFPVL